VIGGAHGISTKFGVDSMLHETSLLSNSAPDLPHIETAEIFSN
jgi:hypothetical protein